MQHCDSVVRILKDVLQIELDDSPETGLLGVVPEFDSMAVVAVITSMEDEYGFEVDDDDITAEDFETVGSLCGFVTRHLKA